MVLLIRVVSISKTLFAISNHFPYKVDKLSIWPTIFSCVIPTLHTHHIKYLAAGGLFGPKTDYWSEWLACFTWLPLGLVRFSLHLPLIHLCVFALHFYLNHHSILDFLVQYDLATHIAYRRSSLRLVHHKLNQVNFGVGFQPLNKGTDQHLVSLALMRTINE